MMPRTTHTRQTIMENKSAFLQTTLIFYLLLFGGWFCIPTVTQAVSKNVQLPVKTRITLAKAGRLVNKGELHKAITLLTTFQVESGCRSTGEGRKQEKMANCGHSEVSSLLGYCYLMEKMYEEAATALDLAVELDDTNSSAWLNLARTHYELHDYEKAAGAFKRTYDLYPEKNAELLYYGAVALLLDDKYQRSINLFEKILSDHPGQMQPEWRENLVHTLLRSNQPLRAIPHIKILTSAYEGEKRVQWQEILLHQFMQLEMVNEALEYGLALATDNPGECRWWKALATIYLQKGEYREALSALVIDGYLEPLDDKENKLVADLYLQLGVPGEAAPRYEQILTSNNDPRLLERLLFSLRQLGKTDEALTLMDKFAPQTKDPALLMQKADLLYERGSYKEAAKIYTKTAQKKGRQKKRALQMAEYAMLQASHMNK